jgi:4-hydroxyacetophenone monooxygenase
VFTVNLQDAFVSELNHDDLLVGRLMDADAVILLMSLVQLTGTDELLDEARPFIAGPFDYMTSLPEALKQQIYRCLAAALRAHWGGRPPALPCPPRGLLQKMMSICVGEPLPDEYVPMMQQDMGLARGGTCEAPETLPRAAVERDGFRAIIVGAGMSGLCAAIKFKEAGIPNIVFEKNPTVGGTWFENTYPGCGVDTPNHFYCYSFEPNPDWPDYFSKGSELHSYFERCADKYHVRENIQFNTQVLSAHFDGERGLWTLAVRTPEGSIDTHEANVVVFAVGQLNRPYMPNIASLETFGGRVIHTGHWDPDIELAGRRVAMIGSGASGMQTGPSIAPEVDKLTIFQRSAHWAAYHPNYHRTVSAGKKWALRTIPYYENWYRFQLFWSSADVIHKTLWVDPAWPHLDRSLNEVNERTRERLIAHIRKEIGDNPALLKKVIPPYPPYGKRMLRDNHWYRMLTRDNVELVTGEIRRVLPDGIVAEDGTLHPVDVIILATGFQAGKLLDDIDITGRGGRVLREEWKDDDPRAYLGITVSGFPNAFLLYGPNTNLAHGGSAIFHTECQLRYILDGIQHMIETGSRVMDCRKKVQDAYISRVDEAHAQMVWAHKGVTSWYKNKSGRVFATTPWRMIDYWKWTGSFDPAEYRWS